jgi:hypothetical protein
LIEGEEIGCMHIGSESDVQLRGGIPELIALGNRWGHIFELRFEWGRDAECLEDWFKGDLMGGRWRPGDERVGGCALGIKFE